MKQHKIYIVIFIAIFLSSCGTLKEGFTNQKKNNTDEFLIEKKSPLVIPPDYNELPIPDEENIENDSNEIKSLISKSKNIESKKKLDEKKSTFENSILKKIKKN
jgi:PBP1b-binding outer membrane lipoprotein LpoB